MFAHSEGGGWSQDEPAVRHLGFTDTCGYHDLPQLLPTSSFLPSISTDNTNGTAVRERTWNCVRAFRRPGWLGGWVAVVDRRWGQPVVECALPVDEVGGGVADAFLGSERSELSMRSRTRRTCRHWHRCHWRLRSESCTARSGPRRRPSPCSLEDCWLHLARTYELNTFAAGLPCYEVIRELEVQRLSSAADDMSQGGGGTTTTGAFWMFLTHIRTHACNVIEPRLSRHIAVPLRLPYTLSVTIGG